MSGSDVKSILITADANAADADSILEAARPNTSATLDGTDTDGGVATFTGGQIVTATTAGTSDSG